MKSLTRIGRRSQASIAALALVSASVALLPAHAAPAAGTTVLRLVSPTIASMHAADLTLDAAANGLTNAYGRGLKFYFIYRNVKTNLDMTWKVTDAAGTPLTDRTVYLIVNKYRSCSETSFTTTNTMQYGDPTNPAHITQSNNGIITPDWCGDDAGGHPQWGSGESSLTGTTDDQGLVTFNLTNTNKVQDAEPAPAVLTSDKTYAPANCADAATGIGCLETTITASLVQHPQNADDRAEDKDLLNIHFVNNAVTSEVSSTTSAPTSGAKALRFKVTDLAGQPRTGVTLDFLNITSIGFLSASSALTDSNGYATVSIAPDCSTCTGISKIKAVVAGTTSAAQSSVIWQAAPSPSPTPTAAKPRVSKVASVAGAATVGKALASNKGTWTGATSYSYKWYACTTSGPANTAIPSGCVGISGATGTSLKLTAAQKGKYIRFGVTAKNAVGSSISVSAASSKVG